MGLSYLWIYRVRSLNPQSNALNRDMLMTKRLAGAALILITVISFMVRGTNTILVVVKGLMVAI